MKPFGLFTPMTALVLVLFAAIGCTTTPAPTLNIDATVEAGVRATAQANPTPDIYATVEAGVRATAQANPTPDIDATLEVKVRSMLQDLSDSTSTPLAADNPATVPLAADNLATVPRVTATTLARAWQDNEIAAELKYSGKTFIIEGRITKIEKKGGVGEVNLDGGMVSVVCKFQSSQFHSLSTFKPQQIVSVQGEVLGVPGSRNIVVERCTGQITE